MHPLSRALVALLAAGGTAALVGCADTTTTAPTHAGPRFTPALPPAARPARLGPRYTGAASDSLLESLATRWAAAGRPEYLRHLRAVRAERDAVLRSLTPLPDSGATGGTTSTPPRRARILTHDTYVVYGGLLNGRIVDSYVVGEMTFEGEIGMINTGFSLVGSAANYGPVAVELASGGGQLLNCLDVMFSTCLKHRLAGTVTLFNAPYCSVRAQGATSFQAWFAPVQIGISAGGISVGPSDIKEGLASGTQELTTPAPACQTAEVPSDPASDSTSTSGLDGGGSAPTGPASTPPPATDYPTADYTCYEIYELMRVQQDPYTWYVWQDMGTRCEMTPVYSRTARAPAGGLVPPLSLAGAPRATTGGAAHNGGRRVVLAASTSIPRGRHAAYVERAPGEREDVILVDRSHVTVQELASAVSLALSRQEAARTRDRGFVVTRTRPTRYAQTNAAVLERSLAALDSAAVTNVPGLGELPNVELVLPPVVREP